jgi:hypothetical protein
MYNLDKTIQPADTGHSFFRTDADFFFTNGVFEKCNLLLLTKGERVIEAIEEDTPIDENGLYRVGEQGIKAGFHIVESRETKKIVFWYETHIDSSRGLSRGVLMVFDLRTNEWISIQPDIFEESRYNLPTHLSEAMLYPVHKGSLPATFDTRKRLALSQHGERHMCKDTTSPMLWDALTFNGMGGHEDKVISFLHRALPRDISYNLVNCDEIFESRLIDALINYFIVNTIGGFTQEERVKASEEFWGLLKFNNFLSTTHMNTANFMYN